MNKQTILKNLLSFLKADSTLYNWGKIDACNMGLLYWMASGKNFAESSKKIVDLFLKNNQGTTRNWESILPRVCSVTGCTVDTVIDGLLKCGFTLSELHGFENLSNFDKYVSKNWTPEKRHELIDDCYADIWGHRTKFDAKQTIKLEKRFSLIDPDNDPKSKHKLDHRIVSITKPHSFWGFLGITTKQKREVVGIKNVHAHRPVVIAYLERWLDSFHDSVESTIPFDEVVRTQSISVN